MNLQMAHQALTELFLHGVFNFTDDLDVIDYQTYKDIIATIEPTGYEVAYDIGNINYIEKCNIDYEDNRAEMIRRERTWHYGGTQAFQLEIVQVPRLILVTAEDESNEPKILSTTWWVDRDGHTIAYRNEYNGTVLEQLGFGQ